ncbi:PREDICTED: uncharacterized protein LOC108974907 [Bactrocera latifrons]|uniref:uncharacterized protein LOC108974907 n=1 Tax=Bactrocera latifrons TaxID=174628 RepID=UPI0008DD6319|nr:PREDICTED: uncharacterized protein LOC108974907 [Bactrocera latifrons]
MIACKKQMLFCILLLLGTFAADGRRLAHRRYQQHRNRRHRTPLLRQVDTGTITGTAEDDDGGTGTGTAMDTVTGTAAEADEEPNAALKRKSTETLIVLKPAQTGDSSRMFKGFFLKKLLGGSSDGTANSGSGYSNMPYIIVNVPTNITNVNQNSLNNTVGATNATTTTTAAPASRRQVIFQPIPFPDTTQYEQYEQRRSRPENQATPQNFILSPSNRLVPVYLPPEVQALMQSSFVPNSVKQPKRKQLKKKVNKYQNNVNPFSAFGHNFRRIEFL